MKKFKEAVCPAGKSNRIAIGSLFSTRESVEQIRSLLSTNQALHTDRKMDLPVPAYFKHVKQGGNTTKHRETNPGEDTA